MTRVGAYSPETAKAILDMFKYLQASGFIINPPDRTIADTYQLAPIYIRNDSGEEIPRFACLQVTGSVELNGQHYIKVVQPVDVTGASSGTIRVTHNRHHAPEFLFRWSVDHFVGYFIDGEDTQSQAVISLYTPLDAIHFASAYTTLNLIRANQKG